MELPKSPFETTMPQSWLWAINELEQTLARAKGPRQDLSPLIALARQIASTAYAQAYRAGTNLRQTLMISTAAQHGLEYDEPSISVGVEVSEQGSPEFCILYWGEDANRDAQILAKSYETDDWGLIHRNLRRDLPNFCYRCDLTSGWETLQPLMVRLWNETHPVEAGETRESR